MKISELIEYLTQTLEEHGDMPVVVPPSEESKLKHWDSDLMSLEKHWDSDLMSLDDWVCDPDWQCPTLEYGFDKSRYVGQHYITNWDKKEEEDKQ